MPLRNGYIFAKVNANAARIGLNVAGYLVEILLPEQFLVTGTEGGSSMV